MCRAFPGPMYVWFSLTFQGVLTVLEKSRGQVFAHARLVVELPELLLPAHVPRLPAEQGPRAPSSVVGTTSRRLVCPLATPSRRSLPRVRSLGQFKQTTKFLCKEASEVQASTANAKSCVKFSGLDSTESRSARSVRFEQVPLLLKVLAPQSSRS